MPVSPTPDDSYYWEIAQAYQQAELEILGQIRDRLDKGVALDDQSWATARLAEIQTMRREATKTLAGVNQSMASKISGSFGNAYKDGELAALKDTALWMPDKVSAVSSDARKRAVEALARDQTTKLAGVMPNILRQVEDDYASVVRSAVQRTAAGGLDRRQATSKALSAALGRGLKTGPSGKLTLPDYITMAMRTGTANALIQGHLDSLGENGMDLVYINPGPRHCERCDEWANVPLYRTSGSPGVHLFESYLSTDKKVKVDVKGSLADAKAAGWGHPNCRCSVGAYLPGATDLPKPRPPWDEEGYQAQQKQRGIENQIRKYKTDEALALDPKERAAAQAKILVWQAAMRGLIKEHPYLKRQPGRESIKGNTPPPTVPKPPAKPKTPKPPAPKLTPEEVLQAKLAAIKAEINVWNMKPSLTKEEFLHLEKLNDDAIELGKDILKLKFTHTQDATPPVAKPATIQELGAAKKAIQEELLKLFDEGMHEVPAGIKAMEQLKAMFKDIQDGTYKAGDFDKYTSPIKPAPKAPSPVTEAPPTTSKPPVAPKTPSGSLKGAKKPTEPPEPVMPKTGEQAALQIWLEKVKAKYEAFAPGKKLENSNNWSYVQKVVDQHDLSALQLLVDNKYVDAALKQEALDAFAMKGVLPPSQLAAYKAAMSQYGLDLAQYKLDVSRWMSDNGITSMAKGVQAGIRHSNADGIKFAFDKLPTIRKNTTAQNAAASYSGSTYYEWNQRLRNEAPAGAPLKSGAYSKHTKDLDGAMGEVPYDVVVHRGTAFSEFGFGEMPPPSPSSMIGKTYRNDGYASTSVGEYAHFQHKPVQLEILLPKGAKATNLMEVSNFGTGEREVLLARGTQYYIHDVYQEGGKWRVVVEVVLPGEDPTVWTPIPGGKWKK